VLVTVKTDCDLSAHMKSILESLTMQPVDKEVLKDLFSRYNFRTWLRELGEGSEPTGAKARWSAPVPLRHWKRRPRAASLPPRPRSSTRPCSPMRSWISGSPPSTPPS
jgi:hypothetical protein